MKITDIHIDSFGHWKGLELPELSSGVTVIYGPNEAGKSTLLHLIRGVLYGFSPNYHARFVPPKHPGNIGGRMSIDGVHGRYDVQRWLPISGPLTHDHAGDLQIKSSRGGIQGKQALTSILGGVDDAIFRNVFAVGLSEMQHLGTLSDTEAAHQLYGLASGADRVSVSTVAEQLAKQRERILSGDRPDSIERLLKERDRLAQSRHGDNRLTATWIKLADEQTKLEAEIEKLQTQLKKFGPGLQQAASREALHEQSRECRALSDRLNELGPLPKIPQEVVQRLEQLGRQAAECRKSWEQLRSRRKQFRSQAKQLEGCPTLLHYADEITALKKRAAYLGQLADQAQKLRSRVEETEFELQGEFEKLGFRPHSRIDALPPITDEMISDLQEPIEQLEQARDTEETSEIEIEDAKQRVKEAKQDLEARVKQTEFQDISTGLAKLEQRIELFKKHLETGSRLESTKRELRRVREENHRWSQKRILPWRGLMLLGIVFSVGGIIALAGMFGSYFGISDTQRLTMGIIGTTLAIASLVMKGLIEFAAEKSADACREEMQSLTKQAERYSDDIAQIAPLLPPSTEPIALQLQTAEEEWVRLNQYRPLEERRVQAATELARAESKKEEAEQLKLQAKRTWRDRLRQYRLPDTLTPEQFRDISHLGSEVGQLRHKHAAASQDADSKEQELREITEQLDRVFERASLVPESDRIESQIEQLHSALQLTRENKHKADELHRKWREAGREQEKLGRDARRHQDRRQQLVARYGVVDAQELKKMVSRRAKAVQLKRQFDRAVKLLADQVGPVCAPSSLRKKLRKGDFTTQLRRWESECDKSSRELQQMLERRGALGQELKQLGNQRQHFAQQLQLAEVEAHLNERIEQWTRLAATNVALDAVRQNYESERQPETLSEASSYLCKLTQQKYQRIWTPFGESTLCVDDQYGQPRRVEHLSRGTREQVFLSLRLALAAAYSRRGAGLALILDDVFVNFDAHRALAAAETVVDFARAGHQVLVFTCHDHIRDVFHSLGVDLRELPRADDIAENPQPVLRSERPLRIAATVEPATVEPATDDAPRPEETVVVEAASSTTDVESDAEGEVDDGLPTHGDAELDHELTYGAPEYDPGFEASRRAS